MSGHRWLTLLAALALAILATVSLNRTAASGEAAIDLPDPEAEAKGTGNAAPAGSQPATAVFAGGCFWGVQAVFQHVTGVISARSGYAGGDAASAHYDIVARGASGHAESVSVVYDPARISYGQLLKIFFSVAHDPTQLDRQGPDLGRQYRSAIFTSGAEQEKIARAYVAQLDKAGIYASRIVTQIAPLQKFYVAEDYHQDYLKLHRLEPYIVINDLPKLEQLKQRFPALYRPD